MLSIDTFALLINLHSQTCKQTNRTTTTTTKCMKQIDKIKMCGVMMNNFILYIYIYLCFTFQDLKAYGIVSICFKIP